MTQENLIKLERLLKGRKPILINNKLMRLLECNEDIREFAETLGDWAYTTDFTYKDYQLENWQTFLRRFLKETYLD